MGDISRIQKRPVTDQDAENITRVEELAYELKVEAVMTKDPSTVTPETSMLETLNLFRQIRISGAPVVNNHELLGIISIEDLIRSLQENDLSSPVSKYMSSTILTIHGSDPVIEALKLFVNSHKGRLPVLDQDNQLIGIITKGDITSGILKALQKDYHAEEIKRYRASHLFEDINSDRSSLILRYNIKQGDFIHGGSASSAIKSALLRLGATPQMARRTGIAVYEAEMNLIIHTTNGGVIRVEIEPHQISINISDDGPGIEDIELAMRPGYSTASETVRELGFGAGMGLVNIKRCVDSMRLESVFGKGTNLRLKIFLQSEETVGEASGSNKET
ncbi:MAG: CBS domain-containing protein [Anaerolineae bacterium]|jgi:CBS domain-containing protein/anti-sigma regulatory factor (Ser/Thr protein kinase)|nr:CBS domain-containing protein [Anaerolineae bacterium]PKO00837.1 MAG: signal transduction protein [Chloroflexi bacterium HGW-Chloroflexi-5]